MRIPALRLALLSLAVASAGTLAAVTSRAEDEAPAVSVRDVMNAVNHPKYGLFGLIKAALKPECTAEDWKVIGYRAGLMVEAGNILKRLTPPRGAEDEAGMAKWKEHAGAYSAAAKQLRAAANTKNLADAQKAMGVINERCEKCHADHQNE
jgi:hypothetical protein